MRVGMSVAARDAARVGAAGGAVQAVSARRLKRAYSRTTVHRSFADVADVHVAKRRHNIRAKAGALTRYHAAADERGGRRVLEEGNASSMGSR